MFDRRLQCKLVRLVQERILFFQFRQVFLVICGRKGFLFLLVETDPFFQIAVADKPGIPDLLVQGLCLFRCREQTQHLSVIEHLFTERFQGFILLSGDVICPSMEPESPIRESFCRDCHTVPPVRFLTFNMSFFRRNGWFL